LEGRRQGSGNGTRETQRSKKKLGAKSKRARNNQGQIRRSRQGWETGKVLRAHGQRGEQFANVRVNYCARKGFCGST